MKVAVLGDDQQTVSCHFGRAPLLLIYDVTNGEPVLKEQRPNQHAAHGRPSGYEGV